MPGLAEAATLVRVEGAPIAPSGDRIVSSDEQTRAELSPEWKRGFAWVERELGGRVCNLHRQGRWRPAYFFDLERDGARMPMYFRGHRGHREIERVADVIGHEASIYRVLEAHGLPVPHVWGVCRDPEGIVMDRLPGQTNLATLDDPVQRASVLDHYIELLAKMHAIDPAEFEAQGLIRLDGERELALGDFDLWVAQYRKAKRRPAPWIEFAIRWVHRNAPRGRRELTFVSADSGQFLFDAGRVTALLDMETGYLGDPLADLGGLLCRDLGEPLGDLSRAFRRYAECSGRNVDLDVVRYHGVRFNLCTPLAMAHFEAGAPPEVDFAMYRAWTIVWGRATLAGIAEILRMPLPEIEPFEERPTLRSPAYTSLVEKLERIRDAARGDEAAFYERDQALRLARALQRAEQLAPEFEQIQREDLARILGHPVDDLVQADEELEALVLAAPPERDAELLRYFYRQILREHELHRPALFEYADRTVQPVG